MTDHWETFWKFTLIASLGLFGTMAVWVTFRGFFDILKLFDNLNEMGKTIIIVTHEDEVSSRCKRVVRLRDGLVQSDERN